MNNTNRKRVGFYTHKGNNTYDISISNNFLSSEYLLQFEDKTKIISDSRSILIAFEAIEKNHTDLEIAFLELPHAERPKNFNQLTSHSLSRLSLINQRTVNFLSSASSFLSLTEVKLGKNHGKESIQLKTWNSFRQEVHASSFSYRLMYELRNYSQHYGLPISNLGLDVSGMHTTNEKFEIRASLTRDLLLSSGFKWNKLSLEIEKQHETMDLKPLLDEYMYNIRLIFKKYLEVSQEPILICKQFLEELLLNFAIPENADPVLFIGESTIEHSIPKETEIIPIDEMNWILNKYQTVFTIK